MRSRLSWPRLFASAASWTGFLLVVLFVKTAEGQPPPVTLQPIQDNTIYAESDSSFGAGPCLQVGVSGRLPAFAKPHIRRALILFDLRGIPQGLEVANARLTFSVLMTATEPEPYIRLHSVLQAWGEGSSGDSTRPCSGFGTQRDGVMPTANSSTWNYAFYGPRQPWAVPGGAFDPQPTDSAVGGETVTFQGDGLRRDVAEWIAHPEENHGWILTRAESDTGTGIQLASRNNPVGSLHPTLTIAFALPTGACCDGNGRCEVVSDSECTARSGHYAGDDTKCADQVCLEPYVDALPIPAIATPIRGNPGGAATYEIAMREFKQKLHRDLPPTTLWGYDGQYPGPTIEATRDQPVQVRWINDLRDAFGVPRTEHYFNVDLRIHGPDAEGNTPRTVVHLHGAHVDPDYDGYPESTYVSGQSRLYRYSNRQRATTLWYHDHALGITRYNVMMGLAGMYLIHDSEEQALSLPAGPYEIPLMVQDRSFHTDGSLWYPEQWSETPFMGDKVLVNGKIWPYLTVNRGKYRFRLLNGSNHRIFRLRLSDGRPFQVIGSDGGLLRAPAAVTRLSLGPAERADVVMDFGNDASGTEVLLQNDDPTEAPSSGARRVMKFVVGAAIGWTTPLPSTLSDVQPIAESEAARTRYFQLKKNPDPVTTFKFRFGDQGWDEMTEFPVLGTTEIWTFANRTDEEHPIHIHLVQFQVLDRYTSFQVVGDSIAPAGQRVPPEAEEAGWKDTARVPKGQMLRVIMRFGPDGYLGNYVFHCHMLEHEDNDMMRQFTVVPPARRGPRAATAAAEPSILWPPDLKMVPVNIVGVTDPTGAPVTIHVTSVTQDEPISHQASAGPMIPILPHVMSVHEGVGHRAMGGQNDDPCVDARVVDGQLFLRRERREGGNGRVYRVKFAAVSADTSVVEGSVLVTVPARAGVRHAANDGLAFNSQEGCIVVQDQPMDMTMARHSSSGDGGRPSVTALGAARVEGGNAIVRYSLAEGAEVSLAVYDIHGRRVASRNEAVQEAGPHEASIGLGHLPHGVYFVRMRADGKEFARRLVRLGTAGG